MSDRISEFRSKIVLRRLQTWNKSNFLLSTSQSGMSLLSVLIAVAISGVVFVAISKHITTSFHALKFVELRSERESIKHMLMQRINCDRYNSSACTSAGIITELYRHGNDSQPYVTKTGTGLRLGTLSVRAECEEPNGGVIIRVNRLKPTSQINTSELDAFLPHPLTKEVSPWSDPSTLLFPAGIALCSHSGPPSGTPSPGNSGQLVPGATCGPDNSGLVLKSSGSGRDSPAGVFVCCHASGGGGWRNGGSANGAWSPICWSI